MNKIDECKNLIKDIRESIADTSSALAQRITDAEEQREKLAEELTKYNKDKSSDIDAYLKASKELASCSSELESLHQYLNQIESEPLMSDEEYRHWCKELKAYCHAEVTKYNNNIIKLLGEVVKESRTALDLIADTDSLLNILQDDLHLGLDRIRDKNGNIIDSANKQKYDGIKTMSATYSKTVDLLKRLKGEPVYSNADARWLIK